MKPKRRSIEAESLKNYKPKVISPKNKYWLGVYDDWYFENDRMSLDPPEEDLDENTES